MIKLKSNRLKQNYKLVRSLRWYKKQGDVLVGQKILDSISLSDLQEIFGEPENDLMIENYQVTEDEAKHLQRKLNQPIELNSYDYFLECEQTFEAVPFSSRREMTGSFTQISNKYITASHLHSGKKKSKTSTKASEN
jgi:glycyl-tRNA synthetase alpha subunit